MRGEEQQLLWAVQALAQPADAQPELFPSYVDVPDELALCFDDWYDFAAGKAGATWSPEQRRTLAALDRLLDEMSGPDKPELWAGTASLEHEKWQEARAAALAVLAAFDWPQERPPLDRALYVRSPEA